MRKYSFSFLGGFLAAFAQIYLYAGRGDWLTPQRLSPALGNALIFAHLFAMMVYFARDSRLHWFPRIILGIAFGSVTWWGHLFFYLYQSSPDVLTMLIGGTGLSLGFWLASLAFFKRVGKIWHFLFVTGLSAIFIYLPICWSYQNYLATVPINPAQALLYFQADNPEHLYIIGIPFALCLAFFANLSLLNSDAVENSKIS